MCRDEIQRPNLQPRLFLLFAAGHLPEFLLPFRKPKRIRTAFSPSQLLKLEQAFEKNQYVVGAERKELAKNLNLSETQVRQTPIADSRNLAGLNIPYSSNLLPEFQALIRMPGKRKGYHFNKAVVSAHTLLQNHCLNVPTLSTRFLDLGES